MTTLTFDPFHLLFLFLFFLRRNLSKFHLSKGKNKSFVLEPFDGKQQIYEDNVFTLATESKSFQLLDDYQVQHNYVVRQEQQLPVYFCRSE